MDRRHRPRRGGTFRADAPREPVPVGSVLGRVVSRVGGPGFGELLARWPGLVGNLLAERARPLRIDDGVLVVAVADHAWASQVEFLGAEILAAVNALPGTGGLRELRVVVRPTP